MEAAVRRLFERYERFFMRALGGDLDGAEAASLYAAEFIAATPAGVAGGKNDAAFVAAMAQGYARYRAIGTRAMTVRAVRLSPIDDLHCVAHVGWTATYARPGRDDVAIDFEVHYLVQVLDGAAKVFGWVSGDEEALLKQHGVG